MSLPELLQKLTTDLHSFPYIDISNTLNNCNFMIYPEIIQHKHTFKELHEYCFGGYEKILEECGNQTPSSIVVFLNKIKTILK